MQILPNIGNHLKIKAFILLVCWLLNGVNVYGQDPVIAVPQDSVPVGFDTLQIARDTIINDTTRVVAADVKYSKDGLDEPIDYEARDSIIYDIDGKKIYLYGAASVKYTTMSMKADYIIFDWENNEVVAEFARDSLGKPTGVPQFEDGDQNFEAKKMRFNFETEKGIIYDVTSTYTDLYVLGSKAKFIAGDRADTTSFDHIYSSDAIFTSCDHPEPHFGIRSKKQKVIPDKLVVVGPSNVEIMGVPTPLWLPFGFFPISKSRQQGLLFPRDYEYSQEWGFGLRNIGYYMPINDYVDLALTTDIYFKGTYGIHLNSNYKRLYKYNGRLGLSFSDRKVENQGIINSTKSFSINWSHNQDARAHPTNRFGGSINIQTNNYQSLNQNDAQSVLTNVLTSNVNFSKSFPGQPFSFSASMSHSQNTNTGEMKITLPTVDFKTQNLFPFKRKKVVGKQKWYEQISMRYSNQLRNQFNTSDSTLFTQQTLDDAQIGMKHDLSANTSFKLLKYFSVNPSIGYKETWYLNSIEKQFIDDLVIDTTITYNTDSTDSFTVIDTTSYGALEDLTKFGFQRFGQFNASVSLNTQIFGTFQKKKGWLRGLRHVAKPSVSFGYTPDYEMTNEQYFRLVETTNTRGQLDTLEYNIFENGIYGRPSSSPLSASIGYSLNNIFEGKYFSKKDSTEQKFKIFDNIIINGSYNIAADSLKWSRINMRGTTRLFNGLSTFSFGTSFDPYDTDDTGRRVDNFYWRETGKLIRFEGGNARLNTSLSVRKIKDIIAQRQQERAEARGDDPDAPRERPQQPSSFLDLFDNFSLVHTLVMNWDVDNEQRDSIYFRTNSVSMRGSLDLTDYWSINVGNIGYDFQSKQLTYPDLGFYRKLHCWQMGVNWQPFRGTYSFYLRVNPSSSLNFLNVPWNKRNVDGFNDF